MEALQQTVFVLQRQLKFYKAREAKLQKPSSLGQEQTSTSKHGEGGGETTTKENENESKEKSKESGTNEIPTTTEDIRAAESWGERREGKRGGGGRGRGKSEEKAIV